MILVASGIAVLVVGLVLSPFWLGRGGRLLESGSVNSPEKLERIRAALVSRWLDDEHAFQVGSITKREWEIRQAWLTNRFIDASRRLEYLEYINKAGGGPT